MTSCSNNEIKRSHPIVTSAAHISTGLREIHKLVTSSKLSMAQSGIPVTHMKSDVQDLSAYLF